jgi:bifunctional UDP-N-acetylglucosamine pyrophosphorylase/glucosamine-1-phosphate N-acetyltransferase
VTFAEQPDHRGTGDATLVALGAFESDDLDDTSTLVVLPAHIPLVRAETVTTLVARHEASGHAATVLTTAPAEPTGYRRVVRAHSRQGDGQIMRLVAPRDCSPEQLALRECGASIYAFRRDLLGPALRRLEHDVGPEVYSLADVIAVLSGMGHRVGGVAVGEDAEVQRVDDRWQLAMAERELRARTNRAWLLNGVTMLDPRQTFIDVTVELGRDVTLFPGTILQGRTVIGQGCEIGPDTRLVDCVVGPECVVQHTVAAEAEIGAGAHVGPYAHLAQGSFVADGATTGPFYTGRSD